MSKTITPGQPLSKFDREYLLARGLNPDAYEQADEDSELASDVEDQRDAQMADKDRIIAELQERILSLETENAALRQPGPDLTQPATGSDDVEPDASEDEVDGEDVPYTEWTNDELRIELSNRDLSTDGKKVELIARLEEHDATAEDDAP